MSTELPVTGLARGVTFSRNGLLCTLPAAKFPFVEREALGFQIRGMNKVESWCLWRRERAGFKSLLRGREV